MKHTKSFLASAITAAMLPSFAQAAGTFLPEGSSPGLGMAGAGDVVNTSNAAVMWANPAAMAGLDGEMMTINAMIFDLGVQFKDDNSTANADLGDGNNAGGILPAGGFFYHMPVNEKVSFGLAVSSLGGAALDYGDSWKGQHLLTNTSLMSLQLNPSLSYRINDQWSVGGGVQLNYAWMEMATSAAKMNTGNDWATGFNLGVYFEPTDKLTLGLSYRSEVEHDFEDSVLVDAVQLGPVQMNGTYQVAMPYVAQASFGGSYKLTEVTTVFSSVTWQQWSEMKATPLSVALDAGLDVSGEIPRNWDDTWGIQLGVEHQLNQAWKVKTGVSYETAGLDDPTLQRPDLPSAEQWAFAVGASTKMGNWDMNFFYEYKNLGEPKIDNVTTIGSVEKTVKGTFEDFRIHFIGMSATQKF